MLYYEKSWSKDPGSPYLAGGLSAFLEWVQKKIIQRNMEKSVMF